MAKAIHSLPAEVKTYMTQACACFDQPSVVAADVKREFGVEVTRQDVERYDPTKRAGQSLGKKLKALFEQTRKQFLEDSSQIAIAHRTVRLRALNRMAAKAEDRGQIQLAAQLLEQAAKEVGDSYTNRTRHEHTGKDGAPIEQRTVVVDEKQIKAAVAELDAEC